MKKEDAAFEVFGQVSPLRQEILTKQANKVNTNPSTYIIKVV